MFFLDAREARADAADHVAVHRDPARHPRRNRTLGNGLQQTVRPAREQLKRLAPGAQAVQLLVERTRHEPLRARAAVVRGHAHLHAERGEAVEREQVVLRAPAHEQHRARVLQALREEVKRRHAVAAAHEKRHALRSCREAASERPHHLHRVARPHMRERRGAASHDLVEQRHAAAVRVEHAERTPQRGRLQTRHAHVHELPRHEHRRELGRVQHEEPVTRSCILVHGDN